MKATSKHLLAITTQVDEITGEVKPLFAFPVDVVKATDDGGEVKLDSAGPSGNRLIQQYVEEGTGEIVPFAERRKGIRLGEEFTEIDAEDLKAIDEATNLSTLVVLGASPLDEVRAKYGSRVIGTHYLQSPAKGGSPKAYRLTYESLCPEYNAKGKQVAPAKAIVTKRTARTRQKLAFIYADQEKGCLVLNELTFANQVREPDAAILQPLTAVVEDAQVELLRKVVGKLPDATAALDTETDEAVPLKQALVDKVIAGEALDAPKPVTKAAKQDDLSALLALSLAEGEQSEQESLVG